MCAWAYNGDWSGRNAAEIAPIIVSLCNAIGDRYEAVGRNRPEWPIVGGGTKTAALEVSDLDGMEMMGYPWYPNMAERVEDLIDPPYIGPSFRNSGGVSQHFGFSILPEGLGRKEDCWTVSSIEADVGLGALGENKYPGGSIFDENFAVRLREVLDRLLYPVCFPGKITVALDELSQWFPDDPLEYTLDGDVAWGNMTSGWAGITDASRLGAVVRSANAFSLGAINRSNVALTVDCGNSENLSGFRGIKAAQILRVGLSYKTVNASTVIFNGCAPIAFSGSTTLFAEYFDVLDATHLNHEGDSLLTMQWGTLGTGGSPFYGTSAPVIGAATGIGNASAFARFISGFTRDPHLFTDEWESTRFLMDISGEVSDQE